MKYFVAKVKYTEPVPDSDKFKKKSAQVLVDAVTVMEAETKVLKWIPANWKDAFVDGVVPAPVHEIMRDGPSETWYAITVKFESDNGKMQAHTIAVNGGIPEESIKKVIRANGRAEFEAAKRLRYIIDEDLT